jgi:hypothetical protein
MHKYKLEQIDIDKRDFNYSTDEIFVVLKDHIEYTEKIYNDNGVEVNLYYRLLIVCASLGYLTNEKLLNHTIDFLKTFDLIEPLKKDFQNILTEQYSEADLIKIKAIYFSLTSLYRLHIKNLKFPKSIKPIGLDINLKNRIIEHNLNEVINSIRKNNLIQFKKDISTMPTNEQKSKINKWVRSALDVGYSYDTKMFKDQVKHLKAINEHLVELEVLQQIKTVKTKKLKKTLFDFIHNVDDKKGFIMGLKNAFPTEQGKSIKAIVLKLNDDKILIYGTKEFKQLFEELEKYFCRNIGSYNSIQNVKVIDKETTETVSKKLNPLIIKYTTT